MVELVSFVAFLTGLWELLQTLLASLGVAL